MGLSKDTVQNILVMGKSGAGKQPRIDVLCEMFGLGQLSTGNIFRLYLGKANAVNYGGDLGEFYDSDAKEFKPDSEIKKILGKVLEGHDADDVILGMKAKYFVESGFFVPDSITNALFDSFFARSDYKGQVLDGFPRTVDQAKFLLELVEKNGTKLDAILLVENDDEAIVKRTVGRRICPKKECGKVFHVEFKPPKDGKFCVACGAEVILRSDDQEDKIRSRLNEFVTKAQPALDYLVAQGVPLAKVLGNLPVFTDAAVKESVEVALKSL